MTNKGNKAGNKNSEERGSKNSEKENHWTAAFQTRDYFQKI